MARHPRTLKADAPYPPGWEPFLAAIKADMDDDTARLVFADWLQENGDEARAEFIRVQCRLNLSNDNPADFAREDELLNANWDRWVIGFPRWIRKDRFNHPFHRGFINSMTVTGARFLKDGVTVTKLTPVQHLTLHRATTEVLLSSDLSEIGGLTFAPVNSDRVMRWQETRT